MAPRKYIYTVLASAPVSELTIGKRGELVKKFVRNEYVEERIVAANRLSAVGIFIEKHFELMENCSTVLPKAGTPTGYSRERYEIYKVTCEGTAVAVKSWVVGEAGAFPACDKTRWVSK